MLAIITVLPFATIGIGAAVLDPNDYKPAIIQAVQAATGRTLSLNGPLRISRSLWPTIEVNDVTLANLPGGTRPDMARAERIEAQLSIPALLAHRIEVSRLTLIGPNILFEQVGDAPNWLFPRPQVAGSKPDAASGSPFSLRIRSAHVQNGMVTTRLPAQTRVVGIRALDLHHTADDGPLDLSAILVYADNQPFSLRASAQPTAGLLGPWTTQLQFAAFDTAASAAGTMDVAGTYNLQVEATAGAMGKLNTLLPEMRLPDLQHVSLSTHVTNGPMLGAPPIIGVTRLHFDKADFGGYVHGLRLGATTLLLSAPGGVATVAGIGQYAGQAFKIDGTFGLPMHPNGRVSLPVDLQFNTREDAGIPAGTAVGSLALKGKLTLDSLRFGGLDATAAVRAPKLAAFRQVLAHKLPELRDVQFNGHVTIPAKAESLGFKDAKLLTHAGDLTGDGTFSLDAGMSLNARLHSTRLDMDAMLEAFEVRLAPPVGPGGANGSVISDTALPWVALRGPAVNLSASIGELTFYQQNWQKVDLALQLKGGRVQAGTVKLALPGGPLEILVAADASKDSVPVSLSVHAPAVPLALLAHYAGVAGQVDGAVRIEAQLRGRGHSLHELAASLDGPFSATVIGGRMSNTAFVKLTSPSLEALGIRVPPQGETVIRCIGLAATFTNGVGHFRTVALDTTYLQLDGVGQVDLRREAVAFKLNPLAQVSGSPVSVPVLVEGPFRAIQGRLEATGLDKLGLLIDGLFGGDHPDTCSDAGLAPPRANPR